MSTTLTVPLTKGEKVDLTKTNPGLTQIFLGLGWDVSGAGSSSYDLDAAAILLEGGKAKTVGDLVYFRALKHSSGCLVHSGDNLTGAGDGDDETISVDFSKVPAEKDAILFCVNIYEAQTKGQNFGKVRNAFVRVVDKATNNELMRYDLSEDYGGATGVKMGRLYRHNGEWKFEAVGEAFTGTWQDLLNSLI